MFDEHDFVLETGMLLVLRYRILQFERYWSPSVLPNANEIAEQTSVEGAIYRVQDLVASKTEQMVSVLERLIPDDPQLRSMSLINMEREANILATLDHAALPIILDYFTTSDRAYFVSPYYQGATLNDIVQSLRYGDVSLKTITQWIIQICDAVAYLHEHDPPLILRTLDAEKVTIDNARNANFIDLSGLGIYSQGKHSASFGVDGYAAPEQYSGEHIPQSDIYSIGALLHYLLTGRDPRQAKRFSFVDRPVRRLNPKVSKDLDMIVYRALAFDPKFRFKTVREMQDALLTL